MAPLTNSRIIAYLNDPLATLPSQLLGASASENRNEIEASITSFSLVTAQAGLDGNSSMSGPGQLKLDVMAKIEDINTRYEKTPSPPPTKQNSTGRERGAARTSNKSGIKKTYNTCSKSARIISAAEQDAAAALLELISRPIAKSCLLVYQKIPVLDAVASPEEHFFVGVLYTLSCLYKHCSAQELDAKFTNIRGEGAETQE